MRFLFTAKTIHPMPPDMALGLMEALEGWVNKHTASKKFEQAWHFPGMMGGGGIINVNSLEELNAIVMEFPLAPFTETEVRPLMEIHEGLKHIKQAMQASMPGGQR